MKNPAVPLLLVFVAAASRLLPLIPGREASVNFAPLMAIALCGAVYLPRVWAILVPFAALLVSDIVLNLHYGGVPFHRFMLISYACYGVAILLGLKLAKNPRWFFLLGGAAASSFLFYFVTNSTSWLSGGHYTKDLAGWWQALTVGQAGYPPTWTFFRNSLVSDLLFTGLFIACVSLSRAFAQAKISLQVSPSHRKDAPAP